MRGSITETREKSIARSKFVLSSGKHGVIIHGITDNVKRGDLLANVTNSLADALLDSLVERGTYLPIHPEIKREMDLTSDPPSVTLHIKAPDGAEATWLCKEAFWADAFPPPAASSVLRWLLKQQIPSQQYVWRGLIKDPANNEDFRPDGDQGKEKSSWTARRFINWIYRLELLATGLFLIPLSVLVPVLLFLIWPLYWMPRFGFLASSLEWLHKLDPFLSRSLGDVKRYIEHGVWSASARGVLENIVIDMLSDEYGTLKDITIVAHSMGAVVTYDALGDGGRIARVVEQLGVRGNSKKLTFISVGGGINQVFRLVKGSNLYARIQFCRPLAKQITGGYDPKVKQAPQTLRDKFFWLDIYARFDPVPAGDLDREVTEQAQVHPDLVKRRRVINLDNPIRDHSYYWQNKALVIPRIARAINGGEYPWQEAGITEEKLKRHIDGVATLVLLRLIMVLVVVSSLVAASLNLVGTLPFLPVPIPLLVALIAVGLYQSIRSWKFGDIS